MLRISSDRNPETWSLSVRVCTIEPTKDLVLRNTNNFFSTFWLQYSQPLAGTIGGRTTVFPVSSKRTRILDKFTLALYSCTVERSTFRRDGIYTKFAAISFLPSTLNVFIRCKNISYIGTSYIIIIPTHRDGMRIKDSNATTALISRCWLFSGETAKTRQLIRLFQPILPTQYVHVRITPFIRLADCSRENDLIIGRTRTGVSQPYYTRSNVRHAPLIPIYRLTTIRLYCVPFGSEICDKHGRAPEAAAGRHARVGSKVKRSVCGKNFVYSKAFVSHSEVDLIFLHYGYIANVTVGRLNTQFLKSVHVKKTTNQSIAPVSNGSMNLPRPDRVR